MGFSFWLLVSAGATLSSEEALLKRLALLVRRVPLWGKGVIVIIGILVMTSALRSTPAPDHFRIELETTGLQAVRLSERALDFGEVDTSQPRQKSFTVTNISTEDVFVNLALRSAPPFGIRIDWLIDNQPPPMFIARGSSVPVVVTIFRTGRDSLGSQTYQIAVSASRAN